MPVDVDPQYTHAFEYNADRTIKYHGEATPGTAQDGSGWRIRKYTYSNSQATKVELASGNSMFDKVWDDRATYSYS